MTVIEKLIRDIQALIRSIDEHWIEGKALQNMDVVDRAAIDEHLALCIEELRKLRMQLSTQVD